MSALLAALYTLCLLLLTGIAFFVFLKNPRSALHQSFALLALALLGWVASLFAFDFPTAFPSGSSALLLLGRFNFACIVLAVPLTFRFVRLIGRRPAGLMLPWLWLETLLLAGLTLLTPLVDRAELVRAGQHVTVYGPLFPLYLLHVLVFLGLSLRMAFRSSPGTSHETQGQGRLIGVGILATGAVALITNVLLPYAFGNFTLIHVGTLSTLLFLAAVGDAVFVHHLFSIRLIVRAAFVYAGLIALALELYSLAVSFLAHLLPFGDPAERSFAATALALIVNAFTQRPVRAWLERFMDHSVFHDRRTFHKSLRSQSPQNKTH